MNYPFELQRREAAAIRVRREKAAGALTEQEVKESLDAAHSDPDLSRLPPRTVGLALSGGGLRAAIFALGILQALAKQGRLREIDFLSTVSAGGFIGSFLGRLFTRSSIVGLAETKRDPCARVESILSDEASPEIGWLRENAQGSVGSIQHLAILWRNIVTVYLILALLGFALFGLLRIIGDWIEHFVGRPDFASILGSTAGAAMSTWWWLPFAVLGLCVIPCAIAYWLAPKQDSRASFSFYPVAGWIALLAFLGVAAGLGPGILMPLSGIAVLLLAAVWLEISRRNLPPKLDPSTGETSSDPGTTIRNRLTRGLSEALVLFLCCIVWVVIDTVARGFALGELNPVITTWTLVVACASPFVHHLGGIARVSAAKKSGSDGTSSFVTSAAFRAGIIAFPIVSLLLVLLDGALHWLFNHHNALGFVATVAGAALSAIFGRAFDLLNYSALPEAYSVQVSRTFLGASNPARISDSDLGRNVQVAHPDDDIAFDEYHPEAYGGPLHLIGLCVNETVDAFSEREARERKGLAMSVGPFGVSVGRKFHAIWSPRPPADQLPWSVRLRQVLDRPNSPPKGARIALRAVPVPGEVFHPFQGTADWPVCVEPLRLSSWIATSGADSGTERALPTSLSKSILLGLLNLRFGYWWDTGLDAQDRPGRFSGNLWKRLKEQPAILVKIQSLMIADCLGRFLGFSHRFWNIADGGRFDNTAIYELLRRRVAFIIAVDGGEDAAFDFGDIAELTRQVRIDFGAKIELVNPGTVATMVPAWILGWLSNPAETLGSVQEIGKLNLAHAVLAQVTYKGDKEPATWIVVLKASLTGDESLDIASYARNRPTFPSAPSNGNFYDEAQWESYRSLGEHIGRTILCAKIRESNTPGL